MDDIQVYDNFLSSEELQYIQNVTINANGWKFGQGSNSDDTVTKIPFWKLDLHRDAFFTKYLTEKIENVTKKRLQVARVYANGQTYGQDGMFHRDIRKEEEIIKAKDYYTFIIYTSDITPDNVALYGGYTIFKENEKIKCVEPIQGRGVLFNSRILHAGMGPSRAYKDLRVSIAFKLIEK